MKVCDFGCGQTDIFQVKNKKWCCSEKWQSCPASIHKNKKSQSKVWSSEELRLRASDSAKLRFKQESQEKKQIRIRKVTIKHQTDEYRIRASLRTKQQFSTSETRENHSNSLKKFYLKETKIVKECRIERLKNSWTNERKKYISSKYQLTVDDIKERYSFFCLIEEIRQHGDDIQVRCKYSKCKHSEESSGWFTPSRSQLYERIRQLEKEYGNGGCYLYCSKECKQQCSLFNVNTSISSAKLNELKIWRDEVLKRSDCLCEYCGKEAEHVHHIKPQKLEPFFSIDPDFGISCCSKCHFKFGHKSKSECSTGYLSKLICKE